MNSNTYNSPTSGAKTTLHRKILSLAIIQALACGSGAVHAANIIVNSLDDTAAIDGNCTLREAIAASSSSAVVDGCVAGTGTDIIDFDNTLSGSTISLAQGELLINSNLTINGDLNNDGTPDIEINAGGLSRVIDVYTGTPPASTVNVTLDGLTIRGGAGTGAGYGYTYGVGIAAFGNNNLTLNKCTVSGNTTLGVKRGGGVSSFSGDLTITNSMISGNSAGAGFGGGVMSRDGTVTVTNSTISNNTAARAGGAVSVSAGNLNITDSALSGNSAPGTGGAVLRGSAGAIDGRDANVSLTNSTVSNNTANKDCGAIYTNYGNITLTGSTLSGNAATNQEGGAICTQYGNITLIGSTLSGNTSGLKGGAIYTQYGNITLTGSTLSGNTVTSGSGGAIYARDGNYGGSISITNSTLSGNTVMSGSGGAIYTAGSSDGIDISITNSTITNNTASIKGGGIYTGYDYYAANFSITNSTITNNTASYAASSSGGGLYLKSNYYKAGISITNSILANNIGGDCDVEASILNGTATTITTNTANLVKDGGVGCGITPSLTVDPMLGILADNGGPTQTLLPLVGSPVLDAGDNTNCGTGKTVATDQRGAPRDDGLCDIGAIEGTTSTAPSVSVQFDSSTATVSEDGTSIILNLTRSGDTSSVISVDYTTSDGTATTPADYTANMATLDFVTGVTSQSVTIDITDDTVTENDENFAVTLSNVQLVSGSAAVALGANASVTVTITDNDAAASTGGTGTATSNGSSGALAFGPWWMLLAGLTSWLRRRVKS